MKNEPAFPILNEDLRSGMTLRDWFAGRALQALIASCKDYARCTATKEQVLFCAEPWELISQAAFKYADAMLAVRAQEPK